MKGLWNEEWQKQGLRKEHGSETFRNFGLKGYYDRPTNTSNNLLTKIEEGEEQKVVLS